MALFYYSSLVLVSRILIILEIYELIVLTFILGMLTCNAGVFSGVFCGACRIVLVDGGFWAIGYYKEFWKGNFEVFCV